MYTTNDIEKKLLIKIIVISILLHKNLASELQKKRGFDDILKNLNKKVPSNKTKCIEAEKKVTELTNKIGQISEKQYDFLLGRMYFTGNDGYQNFLVLVPMLSSVILDGNKKFINWILNGISSENIKLFDINLEPIMSNLTNGKVILKFNNSVLVQKIFLHYLVTLFQIYPWSMN